MIIAPPIAAREVRLHAQGRAPARAWWLAGIALAGSVVGAADNKTEHSSAQLEKLRARIESVQTSLDRDRRRQDALRTQLEDAERQMTNLSTELTALNQQIAEQSARWRRTDAERAEAEAVLQQQRAELAQQIRAAYMIGRRGQTKLLLNQDHGLRLSRVMTYYDYLNRARVQRIDNVLAQVQTLAVLARRLQQETAALESTRNLQQGTLTAQDATRRERQRMMQSLASRIQGAEGQLRQLQADERALAKLLAELRSALADIPAHLDAYPFGKLKGRLPWPLKGKLLASYGTPKAGGQLKWNGLWIAGVEGTAVKAIAYGRVVYVGWMHRYGLIAVLEHEGGYYSLYGHNQNVAVGVGDWVQAGDVIARVGTTGGHEQSGLYFELRKGAEALNPRSWLRRG